jgi:excisionase family DNA binding protein
MADLLTTKQLQDLLKIDRTTIYRMLEDGRLTGVKIGNQWRFTKEQIDALMSGGAKKNESEPLANPNDVLPINCIQPIQDVFADIAQVSSLTTAPDGTPLTRMSSPCKFCSLILGTRSGKEACIASWQKLGLRSEMHPRFVTCHAGLHYARARIEIDGDLKAMVIAGQFYSFKPDRGEEQERVTTLAKKHNIDPRLLYDAAAEIPVVDERKEEQIGSWMEKIAHTFEHFGRERSEMMTRLRKIADISSMTKKEQ